MNGTGALLELDEEFGDADGASVEEERRMELEAMRRQEAAEAGETAAEVTPDEPEASGATARDFGTPLLLLGAAKDTLDWVLDFIGIGEIPVVGQIPGILFTLFIAFYLAQNGLLRQRGLKRAAMYGGFIADNLPLLNNVPFMTPVLWILRRAGRLIPGKNAGARP